MRFRVVKEQNHMYTQNQVRKIVNVSQIDA